MGRQGKMTDEMRRLVLAEVALGISYRQIALRHDVSESRFGELFMLKTWQDRYRNVRGEKAVSRLQIAKRSLPGSFVANHVQQSRLGSGLIGRPSGARSHATAAS